MKRLTKYILPLFLIVLLTANVNASELKCNEGKTVRITETSEAKPFGFDATLPICDWVDTKKFKSVGVFKGSYDDGIDFSNEKFLKDVEAMDAKSADSLQISRCGDSRAYIEVTAECVNETVYINYDPAKVEEKVYTSTKPTDAKYLSCYGPYQETKTGTKEVFNEVTGENEVVDYKYKVDYYTCFKCRDGYTKSGNGCKKTTKFSLGPHKIPVNNPTTIDLRKIPDEDTTTSGSNSTIPYNGATIISNTTCEYKKELFCPIFRCDTKLENVGTCTPTFKTEDGAVAYCVNPSQPFTQVWKRKTSEFIEDPDFNPNKCEHSYSTVDCGYANILIEGKYNKVCNNAINLALRLWGEHSGQRGFNKTGVSNAVANGGSCSYQVFAPYAGSFVNVYRETLNYITNHFESKAYELSHIDITKKNFEDIICRSGASLLGVACSNSSPHSSYACSVNGGTLTTYQAAFNLYFNTLVGNANMREHLASIFKGDEDLSPTDAVITHSDESTTESVVEITFPRITESTEKGVVVDCDELAKHPEDPNYAEIMPYCKVKIELIGPDGKPLKDADGNPITDIGVSECKKGDGCTSKIIKYAICDTTNTNIENVKIRIKYTTTRSKESIKKYYSCEDPDSNQMLFAFYDDNNLDHEDDRYKETERTEEVVEEFSVRNFSCGEKSKCNDLDLRISEDKCVKTSPLNKTKTSSVKDPSLSCIVNMSELNKARYDYTNYLGLNSNLCRVYCSDEVSYKVPTVTKINSGLSFKYNIDFSNVSRAESQKNILLSSVVIEKRSCVSEIYFTKKFPDSSLKNIQRQYGLTNTEMSGVTNWTTLFGVLAIRASKKEGSRTENLNELIYDLYNCNLYSELPGNVKKPKNKVIGTKETNPKTVYEYIKTLFSSSNNYGIGKKESGSGYTNSCELSNNNNTCVNLESIYFEGGAEVYGKVGSTEATTTRVGKQSNGESIDRKSIVGSNNIGTVKYCSGNNCLTYTTLKDEKYTLDNFSTTKKEDTVEHKVTNNTITKVNNITIPTNDYASFNIVTEIGFYNSSEFETYPYTGYVKKVSTNSNKAKLEKYVYPMSKNAYTLCSGEDNKSHYCGITQNFGKVGTFFRKSSNDDFSKKVSNRSFGCFIEVEPPEIVKISDFNSTNYRNVSLSNLFPSGTIPSNWNTTEGQEAITQIEKSADRMNTDDYYLEYSVKLTPDQINYIKNNYNKGNYIDDTILIDSCKQKDGMYFECKTTFMEKLKSGTQSDNSSIGTLQGDYRGKSKYTEDQEKK